MKIAAEITQEQKDFLGLIVHQDAASSIGGKGLPLGNSVQWCIDACMRIEKLYGIDACYVAWHDIRLPENDPNPSESNFARKHSVTPVSEQEIKEEAEKAMNYLIAECASSERTALINMMRDMRDDYLENLTANSKQHTEK